MPITLTTPFAVPNGTRLVVSDANPNDNKGEMRVFIQMKSPGATDHRYAEVVLTVRNGPCDRVTRGTMGADQGTEVALIYQPAALSLATGYTDAVNTWRAGATVAARRAALETHLLAVGVIHSSLTGT